MGPLHHADHHQDLLLAGHRLIVLFGISGIFSGLAAMAISPFGGFIVLLSSIASVVVGIVFSRIAAEFILIVFRINEHLGAIRDQGQMH